ncbi:MAG: hypothetical protein ACMUIE_05695 [Thermoplasmatota archaeon]
MKRKGGVVQEKRSGRAAPFDPERSPKIIRQRQRNEKEAPIFKLRTIAAALLLAISLQAFDQPLGDGGAESSPKRTADYGIFDRIEELHAEEESRMGDPEVQSKVNSYLSSMDPSTYDFQGSGRSGFQLEDLRVPEPITSSPIVFEALSDNPIIDDDSVMDWLLPPPLSDQGALNYIVLTQSGERRTWGLGSMVPRLGLVVDTSLDKWLYIDADGDPGTGNAEGSDIRARMTFGRDLLQRDWEVSLIPPSLKFNNAGLRIELEALETQNGESDMGGSVFFIKGISYQGKNYIWSVGIDLEKFMDSLTLRVRAKQWRANPDAGLISQLLSSGTVNLNDLKLLDIIGPYTLSYEFNTVPERMGLSISVIRVLEQEIQDRAYLGLSLKNDVFHEHIVDRGSLSFDLDQFGSPISSLQWSAGANGSSLDDTMHLELRYAEFGSDLVDAMVSFPIMPSNFRLDLAYSNEQGDDMTILDLTSRTPIASMHFLEVIYPRWKSGDTTEWNATEVVLKGIPKEFHLETTATVPFEEGSGGGLNIFDTFMSQIAGRFYRLGAILRQIPRTVAEMPGSEGSTKLDCMGESIRSIDYIYTSGPYLNSSGNWAAFYDHGGTMPAISAHIEGLSYYSGVFTNDTDITLGLSDVQLLRIIAVTDDADALITIEDIPERIHLHTSGEVVSYDGSENGEPSRIGSVVYRYRDRDLFFDVNVRDIPSSLSMLRSPDQVEVVSGEGSIGSVEIFSANSTRVLPIDLSERNFASVNREGDDIAVGLRLNRFRSLTYNNGTEGFIEINTMAEANFYVIMDDRETDLEMEAIFAPLPPFTHIDTPSVVGAPEIGMPDILGIESISDYSEILLSLSELGKAPIELASSISEGLTETIGQYSTGFSISWNLARDESNLDLILSVRKEGVETVPDARWTHGIWIEQSGMGEDSTLKGNIYLEGMPTTGSVSLSFSEETITASLDFNGYRPGYDWMMIRTAGVQDRDISLYFTGLEDGMDFKLDMEIITDLEIGGRMIINMDAELRDKDGGPLDLGPMVATLRKSAPILSIRQMYLPEIPSLFNLEASIERGLKASYSASKSIEYLYFKITKMLDGKWSQVYALFHDLPLSFDMDLVPNDDFTIQEPFPLQGLPSIDISTSSREMDIFIEYDGSGFGQRGRYKIYADNVGNTTTFYDGTDYVIDSDGIGFLSLELERLPAMESFTLTSMMLLGNDLRHMRLSVDMGFGIYPVIRVSDADGESFQIKLTGQVTMDGRNYEPDLYFLNFRTRKVIGIPLISGISVNKDTTAVNMGSNDGGYIMPAPILTLWGWLIGGIF